MRNYALSWLILDILLFTTATMTAVTGLSNNQVLCILITAVLFLLAGTCYIIIFVILKLLCLVFADVLKRMGQNFILCTILKLLKC